MKAGPRIAKSARTLAIVTAAIYMIFFVFNMVLQTLLDKEAKTRDEYIDTINKNSYVEEQVKTISRVTKLYKDTKMQNPDIAPSLQHVTKSLEATVNIKELAFNRDDLTYEALVEARRATSLAMLIQKLLESKEVDSITIEFVQLSPKEEIYNADLLIQMR